MTKLSESSKRCKLSKISELAKNRCSKLSKSFMLSLISISIVAMEVFAAEAPKVDDSNPYVKKAIEIFKMLQGYALALIGVITVVKVVQYAMQYQAGSDDEKVQAVKLIRKTLIMSGGIFFLVWFAGYVFVQFSQVTPT